MPPESAIAVVGLAARLPGAPDVATFWRNVSQGVESVTFFEEAELLATGVPATLLRNPRYVRAKPFVDGVDLFDAGHFGMSAREAELTDPQHRLFLEICAEALESGGYASEQFRGTIGVFAGAGLSAYLLHNLSSGSGESMQAAGMQLGLGNVQDFLATRVAYRLNLKGPAYSVQSACSTSLLAVHLACQNLLGFECDLALAGGVSLSLPTRCGYLFQDESMFSPDGHCRPFDAAARGTIFGNGAGVVLLKRLEDALRDGDTIHALVIGSAVNNDGAMKAGFTAPSVAGQSAVIAEAVANAGVSAETIGYVEAHGTGTVLGDPIEIEGLSRAFGKHTSKRQFCAVGSVKSNIGHLDTAAGVSSFIKAVLGIERGMIPPSLNYERPNPRIEFAETPFFVNTTLRPWPTSTEPRRAGVSAFGLGGTNVHVVLQEPPAPAPSSRSRTWHILPIAARTGTALARATTDLADFLDDHPGTPLAEVAYTLQVGRRGAEHRRVTLVRTVDDAIDNLLELSPQAVFTAAARGGPRPLVFMFPGQGTQYAGMGAELYRDEPAFRQALDRAGRLLAARLGFDPVALMLADTAGRPDAAARLREADAEHAVLFAFEYALAELWRSWGLEPEALIGMSIGECTAAAVSGVLSIEDACTLVAARGRLSARVPPGAMLAVPLAAESVRPLLDGSTALALVNTRTACVVSGERDGIAALESRLASRGVVTRRLDTTCAYHSPLVDAAAAPFEAAIAALRFHAPRVPFISGATGRLITPAEATDPGYWVRQLRQPVYFLEGIRELLKDASRVFLEVGPGLTLSGLTRQNADPDRSPVVLPSLPDPRERRGESQAVLTTLGKLWLFGINVDWPSFHSTYSRRRIPLPTYPFERARYWVDPGVAAAPAAGGGPARLPRTDDWFAVPTWTRRPLPPPSSLEPRTWLLFAGDDELSGAIAARLIASERAVRIVVTGERFERMDAVRTAIDPRSPEHHEQLLTLLAAEGFEPDTIVHAWSLDVAARGVHPDARAALALDRAFYPLIWLGQALGRRADRRVRIGIVTPAVHVVVGGEAAIPEAALCLGPALVLGQEMAHVSCRHIDLGAWEDGAGDAARRILDEVRADEPDRRVALRGPYRWVQRHEQVSIPAPVATGRLKRNGVYLITGGSGGIGLTLAALLARDCAARLVLVSRSGSVPADTVASFIGAGAEVMVVAADVTDEAALVGVVTAVSARWGKIDGVVHAAGVPGGGLIALKTREAADRVLAPKVQGTLALERAVAGQPLDFFVVCSSLASLAGGLGQVDYCAANAFLDAWAGARAADGRHTISIDWDAWQQVGMAVTTAVPDEWAEVRAEHLAIALTPDEGADVFRRLVERGDPHVAVCTVGLDARLRPRAPARDGRGQATRSLHPRPELTTGFVPPGTESEHAIAAVWRDVLGLEQVGVNDNFFELGGDSLTALRVVDRLKEEHGVELAITMFYAAPTIRLLAGPAAPGASDHAHTAAAANAAM